MSQKTFIAAGDIFITRRIPKEGYEGFDAVKELVEKHDVKFANLEMTFYENEGIPAVVSGGTWAMADPRMLDDIQRYGFNIYNTANNHSGDYSYEGVPVLTGDEKVLEYLQKLSEPYGTKIDIKDGMGTIQVEA